MMMTIIIIMLCNKVTLLSAGFSKYLEYTSYTTWLYYLIPSFLLSLRTCLWLFHQPFFWKNCLSILIFVTLCAVLYPSPLFDPLSILILSVYLYYAHKNILFTLLCLQFLYCQSCQSHVSDLYTVERTDLMLSFFIHMCILFDIVCFSFFKMHSILSLSCVRFLKLDINIFSVLRLNTLFHTQKL